MGKKCNAQGTKCMGHSFKVLAIHCRRNPNECVDTKGESNMTNCVKFKHVVSLSADIPLKGEKFAMKRGLIVTRICAIQCKMYGT